MQTLVFHWSNPDGPLFNGKNHPELMASEILCGGPRGPGKSELLRAFMAQRWYIPGYMGLILRHTSEEMKEFVKKAWPLYQRLGFVKRGNPTEFHHPVTGAVIYTGYLKDEKSFEQYRGHEYHDIGIDEAQRIALEELYVMLLGSNRTADPKLRPRMLLTANPDGPGNAWLKARFIRQINNATGEFFTPGTPFRPADTKRVRIYIPGKLSDNPQIQEADPDYIHVISDPSLPAWRRRAWVDGDWDASIGQFFDLFRPRYIINSEEPEWAFHVVPSHELPPWCHLWASLDWGYGDHSAFLLYAVGPDRRIHVIAEHVVAKSGSDELGADIAKLCLPYLQRMRKPMIRVYTSPDAFHARDKHHMIADQVAYGVMTILGPGAAVLMNLTDEEQQVSRQDPARALQMRDRRLSEKKINGNSIWFTPANNAREAGWSFMRGCLRFTPLARAVKPDRRYAAKLLRERGQLAFDEYMAPYEQQTEEVLPMLRIHDHCQSLIVTIPMALADPKRPNDVKIWKATERELGDDTIDSCRMGLMGYQAHEHKVPIDVWVSQRVAANAPAGSDINIKIQMAMQAKQQYDKQFPSDSPSMSLSRDALALRR